MGKIDFIENELTKREANHLLRRLKRVTPLSGVEIEVDGRRMLNFCSNDYLGLYNHPFLKERSKAFIDKYGAGSTASRLVCGNYDCFEKVENRLSELTGQKGALVFNSGYQANVTLLPALTDRDSLILSDALNHNSIIQGSLLSRCAVKTYEHNNIDHLENILKQYRDKYSRVLIVTESIFSMDGDQSDIDSLISIAEQYDSILVLDEAHATGVTGKNGMGLGSGKNVDVVMGTFSKAAGSFGAYVASDMILKDYLINFCHGLIYSTALPPSVLGTIDGALELIPKMEKERERLMNNSQNFRDKLTDLGFNTGKSTTQIIPVIIGSEKDALKLSKWLEDNNVYAMTIRPPTVPEGESRIRLALTSSHTQEQMDTLIELLKKWRKNN
ncbi:8-amino-7-oxononanoate synthase [Thermodesulfobacteriota bacterium]